MTALSDGKCARTLEFSDSDRELMGDLDLITMKPVIYVANVSEDEAAEVSPDNSYYKTVKEIALSDGSEVIPVCAGLEAGDCRAGARGKSRVSQRNGNYGERA